MTMINENDIENNAIKFHEFDHAVSRFLSEANNNHFSKFRNLIRKINLKENIERFSLNNNNKIENQSDYGKQLFGEAVAWAKGEQTSLPIFNSVIALYDAILDSSYCQFSEFIHNLKEKSPEIFETYQSLEKEIYPSLGLDHSLIFNVLKQKNQSIRQIIPPQYRDYVAEIEKIKGTPLTNMFSATLAYAIGFAPYVLGNIVASQLTQVSPFARLMLSAAPTAIGGFARFWVANQVDEGHGKRAMLFLMTLGIVGLFGLLCLINTIRFDSVKSADAQYWAFFVFNVLSGAGIANYSASLPMAAQAAPNDSVSIWRSRLAKFHVEEKVSCIDQSLSGVLRKGPKEYLAIVAGIGSLTPSITLMIAAIALPHIGLRGIYALFGAITLAGTLGAAYFLQNSILDQLQAQNVPYETAKEIATWMGQTLQSPKALSIIQRLKGLDKKQSLALIVACFNYITTFGTLLAITSTGTLTLSQRGVDIQTATYYTAAISGLSSLSRALMAFSGAVPLNSSTITNLSFLLMIIASAVFAFSASENIWFPMLILFSIANGVGNYGVFAQISETLSEVIGLASGLSGASGAISALFISIAFASLTSKNKINHVASDGTPQSNTAYEYLIATGFCSMSLVLNLAHEYKRKKDEEVARYDSVSCMRI